MSRVIRTVSAGAAAAALFLIVAPTQAQAANESKSCEVAATSCSTGSISPNALNHYVNVDVSTSFACSSDWAVYDTVLNVRVANGHVGRDAVGSALIGSLSHPLTNKYKLTLSNTCWDTDGVISN